MLIKIFVIMSLTLACGANPYASFEKEEPAEDATVALEENNAEKAISILTKALEKDPGNTKYISILALAYAQRAGLDPLSLAQKMGSGGTSTSSNGITALFSIMPDASDQNISDIDTAVRLLISIPSASRIKADILKLAMFQTAALTLRSKKLDKNGDGILSIDELLTMTPANATDILRQLANAAGAFSTGDTSSSTDKAAAQQITKIQAAIAAEPGADDQQKLQSYLSKSSS